MDGHRHIRDAIVENNALSREVVDAWRLDVLVTVIAEPVVTERVDTYQYDVSSQVARFRIVLIFIANFAAKE